MRDEVAAAHPRTRRSEQEASGSAAALRAAVAVTALLALVAAAVRRGPFETGGSDAVPRLPRLGVEYVGALVVVAALAVAGVVAVVFVTGWRRRRPEAEGQVVPEPSATVGPRKAALVLLGLLAGLSAWVAVAMHHPSGEEVTPPARTPSNDRSPTRGRGEASPPAQSLPAGPDLPWIGGALAAGLAGALVLLAFGARGPRRTGPPSLRRDDGGRLSSIVRDAIEDLRAEPDPRRAVIAAYARMEQDLGGAGLGRRPAEAPYEYLDRLLGRLNRGRSSAARLTELFELARFSSGPVDEAMRQGAIDALRSLDGALDRDLKAEAWE